jgi:hypothetical protein
VIAHAEVDAATIAKLKPLTEKRNKLDHRAAA